MENRTDLESDSGKISVSAFLSQGERVRYAIKLSDGASEEEAVRLIDLLKQLEEELWKWKAETDTARGHG